ncbi:MAG: hypothetical protein ACRYHQ_04665 [Janthinobacterium lividum]
MDQATLSRLRPDGNTSGAIEKSLTELQAERHRVAYRKGIAQQNRGAALVQGSEGGVRQANKQLQEAAEDAEMLDAMEAELGTRLQAAQRVEASQAAALEAAVERANRALAAYVAAAPGYTAAAATVAEICRLDQEVVHAIEMARRAAQEARLQMPRFAERPIAHFGPQHGVSLSAVVVLPHMDGTPGLLWGKLAAEHRPQSVYAHPDAQQRY